MNAYTVALTVHLASGTLALLLFWIAAAMKKGTPLHRRIGQLYLLAMIGILISGVPLVFGVLERGAPIGAIFLTYLLVLVSNSCWNAWRAIRDRRDHRAYYGGMFWSLAVLSAGSGVVVVSVGVALGVPLLMVFGSIGVVSLVAAVFAWRRAPGTPNWWLREHYGAMIGNGVATHIAFFAIGLQKLLPGIAPGTVQLFAWFAPLVGALIAGWWLNRRYGRISKPRTAAVMPAAQTRLA